MLKHSDFNTIKLFFYSEGPGECKKLIFFSFKHIWILLVVKFLKIAMTDFPLLGDLLYKRTLAGGSIGRHPIEIFEVVSCY